MRFIFIPGFGEDESIFSKIAPHIAGEQLFIDNWKILEKTARKNYDVLQYAQELIALYKITQEDVIIGHSMGGWVGYHIKHLTQCKLIQIASWTDFNRVVLPIKNPKLIYWLVRRGIYLNTFIKKLLINRSYKGKASEQIFSETFDRLIQAPKESVIHQLQLILTPISEKIIVNPDLRIHAKADVIIRPHLTDVYEVSGDHFTLYTSPQEVYEAILKHLLNL